MRDQFATPGDVRHMKDDRWRQGLDPHRRGYMSFAEFSDPDGNLWLLQEVPGLSDRRYDRATS